MAKIIVVDETRCLGCNTCLIQCAMAHTDAAGLAEAIRDGAKLQPRLRVKPSGRFGAPLLCRHCEDAPCIGACKKKLITRASPDGPVLLDSEHCTGCRLCMRACPFGVIEVSRKGKVMVKCDLCIRRLEAGELPACVAGCPTGALKFVKLDDSLRQKRREDLRQAKQLAHAEKADGPDKV